MKTVSDCLRRNSYAVGMLKVILQGCSRNKALILHLDDNKTVFTLSFDPFTTATIPIPDISVSSEPFSHPSNSALGHSKDTCHMPLAKPSFRHTCPFIYHIGAVLFISKVCPILGATIKVAMHKQSLNIMDVYMKVHANGTPCFYGYHSSCGYQAR